MTAVFASFALSCMSIATEERLVTQADCDKIELGMSLEHVGELCGYRGAADALRDAVSETMMLRWTDEYDNNILLSFDATYCVTAKRFTPFPLSFPERMKRRFERRIGSFWPALLLFSHAKSHFVSFSLISFQACLGR